MTGTPAGSIRLGLIGDNMARSKSPLLHLGAEAILCVDLDPAKAQVLAAALRSTGIAR